MSSALIFRMVCIAAAFRSVSGTATLVPSLSSASCSGHLSNLTVTSITCDYSNNGCTFGSEVFVTGQVTANADLPRPMEISAYKTVPNLYSVGSRIYSSDVEDVCSSGKLSPVSYGDGDGQTCPGSGVYNFNFIYENFGSRNSWYAGWSGYSFGMVVHFKHEGGGSDYAKCHINVSASHSSDDSYATSVTFVSIAALGLAGIFVGLFVKRRKERFVSNDQNQSEERTKELATNFELVQDSAPSFV